MGVPHANEASRRLPATTPSDTTQVWPTGTARKVTLLPAATFLLPCETALQVRVTGNTALEPPVKPAVAPVMTLFTTTSAVCWLIVLVAATRTDAFASAGIVKDTLEPDGVPVAPVTTKSRLSHSYDGLVPARAVSVTVHSEPAGMPFTGCVRPSSMLTEVLIVSVPAVVHTTENVNRPELS